MNNNRDLIDKLLHEINLFTQVLVGTTVANQVQPPLTSTLAAFVNPHSILCWAVFDGVKQGMGAQSVATVAREYLALTAIPKETVEAEFVRWRRAQIGTRTIN